MRNAVRIAPGDAVSWYQLGLVESDMASHTDAIGKLRRAIALDPDLPGVQTTLAHVQFSAGQLDSAKETLREALRIDPYDSAAWDLAGRVLTTARAFPEAFFNFERAIYYRPAFAPHLYDYALALWISGAFERAEEFVRTALRADNRMAEAHALLGSLLANRRQLAEATSEYREALRLRPGFARTRLDLASVLAAQGKTAEAVEQLREVTKSGDTEAARSAAEALRKLGQ